MSPFLCPPEFCFGSHRMFPQRSDSDKGMETQELNSTRTKISMLTGEDVHRLDSTRRDQSTCRKCPYFQAMAEKIAKCVSPRLLKVRPLQEFSFPLMFVPNISLFLVN